MVRKADADRTAHAGAYAEVYEPTVFPVLSPRVLVVGGYGTFGGRLVRLISDIEGLTVMVAGRSLRRAEAFCGDLAPANAKLVPIAFDREGDAVAALREASPHILVDATGPFQNFGDDPYRLVRACIDQGINYLDLADGADFVDGISGFDATAADAGVFVLSGVSSFPVLTTAVVRRLSEGMRRVEGVAGGIAPSPYAGVGLNVIRAVLGYAGMPVRTGIADAPTAYGLTGERIFTIAPPGAVPLRPTLFSLVDVPDLRTIPEQWPGMRSVWMGAGPVPEILHRVLISLAKLVSRGLLPPIAGLAPLAHAAINVLRWGEDRGGMFVVVDGISENGHRLRLSWHMVAEGDDGPMIPSMAAEALIRKWLSASEIAPGARNATRDLDLADYEAMFATRRIVHGIRHAVAEDSRAPLYMRILDRAFERLPAPVRDAHGQACGALMAGRANVDRGNGLVARAVAAMSGFPETGRDIPVQVEFAVDGGREIWRRHFAGRPMTSIQEMGTGRFEGLLVERLGPLKFGMAIVVESGRLVLIMRRWTLLGIPLPLSCAPRSIASEHGGEGRFNFDVEISHPLLGRIVRYAGWLRRVSSDVVERGIASGHLVDR